MLTQLIYTEQMKDYIKKEIIKVLKEIYNLVDVENIVEIQKTSNKHVESDYFTNIAMKLAKTLGEEPNRIAETIVASIDFDKNCKVWVAKPGYINFTLNQSLKNNIVLEILESTNLLTSVETKDVKNIIVEFVSANPTGPLHVGHGRGAIYGNIISKYLEIQGHKVHKEYYVNDFGNQINKLVISVFSRIDKSIAQGCSDLYEGSYINDIYYWQRGKHRTMLSFEFCCKVPVRSGRIDGSGQHARLAQTDPQASGQGTSRGRGPLSTALPHVRAYEMRACASQTGEKEFAPQ